MTKYLIENIGEAEQPVTLPSGKVHKLGRGQNLVTELDDNILAWANQSAGLRVSKRKDEPKPEPTEAKAPEPAPKTKQPAAKA